MKNNQTIILARKEKSFMVVNKMKRAYVIEFGGEKEVDEMNALE